MNLDQAFDQYVSTTAGGAAGTTDLTGVANGDLGNVTRVGWDFGGVAIGGANSYFLEQMVEANTTFNVTLSWYIDNDPGSLADFSGTDYSRYADLNLRVVEFDNLTSRNIIATVAESVSLYNSVEHLSFANLSARFLAIQVVHNGNHWNFDGKVNDEFYGVAWHVSAVPEPSSMTLVVVTVGCFLIRRRRAGTTT